MNGALWFQKREKVIKRILRPIISELKQGRFVLICRLGQENQSRDEATFKHDSNRGKDFSTPRPSVIAKIVPSLVVPQFDDSHDMIFLGKLVDARHECPFHHFKKKFLNCFFKPTFAHNLPCPAWQCPLVYTRPPAYDSFHAPCNTCRFQTRNSTS